MSHAPRAGSARAWPSPSSCRIPADPPSPPPSGAGPSWRAGILPTRKTGAGCRVRVLRTTLLRRRRGGIRIGAGERTADPTKRVGERGRDHEHLVGVALREPRQHLQVLVGQELLVGVAVVDRLEDCSDRLGFAFGTQDRGLLLPLGAQHRRLLLTLG